MLFQAQLNVLVLRLNAMSVEGDPSQAVWGEKGIKRLTLILFKVFHYKFFNATENACIWNDNSITALDFISIMQ